MACLRSIVAALGGDLVHGGQCARIPGPGHSPVDRSISLRLVGGRVLIHSFGSSDWSEVRTRLVRLGLIDRRGRLTVGGVPPADDACPRPDSLERKRLARAFWEEAVSLSVPTASMRHLRYRVGRAADPVSVALRHHRAMPVSVYSGHGCRLPALLARLDDAGGELTAIEIVYLRPDGRCVNGLRIPRKTAGVIPAGSAVRLFPAQARLLVGEGVMTVLSAADRFGMPGWALLSARNLAAWSPPPIVRQVTIAADRGPAGEQAAARLACRLRVMGVASETALPPEGCGDWNDAARQSGRAEEGG